ncbi:MAG: hypothetical protein IPI46_13135 [Bacteroidetes bacterium]|nr:hypothetical protein [Bacteroidota bacterium]
MQKKSSLAIALAKLSAFVFHPVFLPSLVFAYLIYFCPGLFFGIPDKSRNWWLVIIAYTTITFPVLVVFLLWRLKFIESMHMQNEKERYGPLIASMLFYFWIFWLFHKQFAAPELVQSFLLGVFLTSVGVFMATIFFKISMHAAGWGSVIAFAAIMFLMGVMNSLPLLVISIFIGGLVGTTRLYLKAHIPAQIYSGYIVGAFMQIISFLIIHNLFY